MEHVWIDTCCIDKSSSAELSEAINSMYEWYLRSRMCFVYLSDVPSVEAFNDSFTKPESAFRKSKWFTRGWTLQELLAPQILRFFGADWHPMFELRHSDQMHGGRNELGRTISEITGIDLARWKWAGVAEKLSWASRRQTSRKEDKAYCLLGLLNVNMPLLYGEGDAAFQRLLGEVVKRDDGHDVLAAGYRMPCTLLLNPKSQIRSILAQSAKEYQGCFQGLNHLHIPGSSRESHFTMTNSGLQIELPLLDLDQRIGTAIALLNCYDPCSPDTRIGLPLWRGPQVGLGGDDGKYELAPGSQPISVPSRFSTLARNARIYISNRVRIHSRHHIFLSYEPIGLMTMSRPGSISARYAAEIDCEAWEAIGYRLESVYPPCLITRTTEHNFGCDLISGMRRLLLVFLNNRVPGTLVVLVEVSSLMKKTHPITKIATISSSSALELILTTIPASDTNIPSAHQVIQRICTLCGRRTPYLIDWHRISNGKM